jgi:hypothetical protein
LNGAALNCVYLVVCWIDRWPSRSWMRRVSCPALARGVAAAVREHVGVNRKGEVGALADAHNGTPPDAR